MLLPKEIEENVEGESLDKLLEDQDWVDVHLEMNFQLSCHETLRLR